MLKIHKIRSKFECVPGAMYCCFIEEEHVMPYGDPDNCSTWDRDGELVYFGADGNFYGADDGEQCWPDYDYLVRQTGPINRSTTC